MATKPERLWAPIVKSQRPGHEYIAWRYARATQSAAHDAFIAGLPCKEKLVALANVRFARVVVREEV